MEEIWPSVFLKDFLDVYPDPALVLKSSRTRLLAEDSLNVCYANAAFLDIIGDGLGRYGTESPDSLTALLKDKCVHPAMSRFVKWIDTVLQNPDSGHNLRTSFQGNEVIGSGPVATHQKIVGIDWEAVVLRKTYIVLTGKTTGTTMYFPGGTRPLPKTPTRPRPSLQHLPSYTLAQIEALSESPKSIEVVTVKAVSPSTSDRGSPGEVRDTPFTTSYFTEGFADAVPSSPKGLDPWRHSEKVFLASTFAKCRF
jgi:hypothetical protein